MSPGSAAPKLRMPHDGDRAALAAFFNRLSASTIEDRYLGGGARFTPSLAEHEIQRLLGGDASNHAVVVAVDGAQIRGVGEFVVEGAARAAELALVVEDAFQRSGIGRSMFGYLAQLARDRGIMAFTGDVRYSNQRVRNLLLRTGLHPQIQLGYGVVRFTLLLESGCDNSVSVGTAVNKPILPETLRNSAPWACTGQAAHY